MVSRGCERLPCCELQTSYKCYLLIPCAQISPVTVPVPVTLSLPSRFYIFTGSSCISDQNQAISYILPLKVTNIIHFFWYLISFPQYASKNTNSGLEKIGEKRKQTPTQAPGLHKMFDKIPSYAEVLGKHFLHGHVVNNCCHVFGDDRLLVTLGIEGFTGNWGHKSPGNPCPLPGFCSCPKDTRCNKVCNSGRAVMWSWGSISGGNWRVLVSACNILLRSSRF